MAVVGVNLEMRPHRQASELKAGVVVTGEFYQCGSSLET
jgi:hypothetical protein